MHSNRQGPEHGMRPDERKKKTMKEYFAYGSNLNLGQMAGRCPESTTVQTARLEGYELAFRGGVLTILPKEDSHVDGLIWSISEQDERHLDRYEGFPRLYGKENVTVQDVSGTGHAVLIYIMEEPWCSRPQEPGGNYLNTVLEGCRQTGVPQEPVLKALERCRGEVRRCHPPEKCSKQQISGR